ncbi:unnamed protein product [Amoebophrya sp. A120]|nr:unnamed protein product [Amoebophrya sp. A120]|eukprot:GSA120T00011420001.1
MAASSSTIKVPMPAKPQFEYALEAKKYKNPEFGEMGTQYCHLYHVRLHELKPHLLKSISEKWGTDAPVLEKIALVNLADCEVGQTYVIIGTLMKKFAKRQGVFAKGKLRDNVNEITDRTEKWASDTDTLSAHDDSSHIQLSGAVNVGSLVTGMVVGLKGKKTSKTSPFVVEDVCLPGAPPTYSYGNSSSSTAPMDIDGQAVNTSLNLLRPMQKDGVYCGFVSGPLLARKEGLATLTDRVASDPRIAHLVLAGNTYSNTLSKIKKADSAFATLGKFVSVDILPGFRDTHVVSFPLERPAPMLFPESAECPNVQGVPSPFDARIGNLRVLGHAGEPTDDIMRCSTVEDTLSALQLSLEARHVAPTCPDTLNCASFKDVDPLLLTESPTLYFAGNQAEAKAARFHNTTLLCVPDLRKQAALVLVNMYDPTDVCMELLEWN